MWPGLDPNTITKRLHTTLTDLRQQLQPMLANPIIRHDERYRLNPDMIETDLHRLRSAITAAATAVTGHQRQDAAQGIIDAYRGELAAGYSWPWLHPVREALRRDLIDACLQLAAAAPPADALDLVRAAITADPFNAALHDQAQGILTAIGEHDAAHALRDGFNQRLLTAGLRPPTATTDRPTPPGAAGR
jgi:two-component SAPR family response regulator